ncbi:hypothetical protein PoB_005369200 [Plakobranchus ocellatus]|uniref:Uncharacterized protein n=1 Tax=Plakobranchus ocellatus TaxID=259542 RepID=A0AAV4C739_9GAST|nr:hypothetical protein PoB_005369200 [Plakobranchus ocellatus]
MVVNINPTVTVAPPPDTHIQKTHTFSRGTINTNSCTRLLPNLNNNILFARFIRYFPPRSSSTAAAHHSQPASPLEPGNERYRGGCWASRVASDTTIINKQYSRREHGLVHETTTLGLK